MNDDPTSFYNALGVTPGASMAEIKQAYRDLAKVWHPDRFTGDERMQIKATEELKKINIAYKKIIAELQNNMGVQGNVVDCENNTVGEDGSNKGKEREKQYNNKYESNKNSDLFEEYVAAMDKEMAHRHGNMGCIFYFYFVLKILLAIMSFAMSYDMIENMTLGEGNIIVLLISFGLLVWFIIMIKKDLKKL